MHRPVDIMLSMRSSRVAAGQSSTMGSNMRLITPAARPGRHTFRQIVGNLDRINLGQLSRHHSGARSASATSRMHG